MTGTSGTRSGGLRKGQSPCELLGGPLGIPLTSMPGPNKLSGVGYVGELVEMQQELKDPFEFPELKCDYPPVASAEMGLISPGGDNLLDFFELREVLSTYDGDLRDNSGGLMKGQSPCELLWGLSGFLSHRCRGLRP